MDSWATDMEHMSGENLHNFVQVTSCRLSAQNPVYTALHATKLKSPKKTNFLNISLIYT